MPAKKCAPKIRTRALPETGHTYIRHTYISIFRTIQLSLSKTHSATNAFQFCAIITNTSQNSPLNLTHPARKKSPRKTRLMPVKIAPGRIEKPRIKTTHLKPRARQKIYPQTGAIKNRFAYLFADSKTRHLELAKFCTFHSALQNRAKAPAAQRGAQASNLAGSQR